MKRLICVVLALTLALGWSSTAGDQGDDVDDPTDSVCRVVGPTEFEFPCALASFGTFLPAAHDGSDQRILRIAPGDALACGGLPQRNEFRNAVVVARRGSCSFHEKLRNVASAGGAGLILINTDEVLLQLGSLEYEEIPSFAVAVAKSDGDRLTAMIDEGQSTKPQIIVSGQTSTTQQCLHRLIHLMRSNAPLVAAETFWHCVEWWEWLHGQEELLAFTPGGEKQFKLQVPNPEILPELTTFFAGALQRLKSKWDFSKDATLFAATTVLALLEISPPKMPDDKATIDWNVVFAAVDRLIDAGLYAHADATLSYVLVKNPKNRLALCKRAFVQFLTADVVSAFQDAQHCTETWYGFNNTIEELTVPHDNLVRLVSMDATEKDLACVRRLEDHASVLTLPLSQSCCRPRRALGIDVQKQISASSRVSTPGSFAFQSSFVEELFHTLTVMGVFMDEFGAFNESLQFFKLSHKLCGDATLADLRAGLAVPIVFDSQASVDMFESTIHANLKTIRSSRRANQSCKSSMAGVTDVAHVRPERASYLQYTITPPTMFIGYQGTNVLPLQQVIANMHRDLFPSLRDQPTSPSLLEYIAEFEPSPGGEEMSRKRRVAFISSWFRDHSVGKLMLGVIQRLDRSRFHVMVYRCRHFLRGEDELSKKFRAIADSFIDLPTKIDSALELLRHERLDVVVYPELGMDAWTVFLSYHRLAPVQCVFWGHPITTGNPAIDYFISSKWFHDDDALVVTRTESEYSVVRSAQYSEQLVLLNGLSTFFKRPLPLSRRLSLHIPESKRIYLCPQTLMKIHPAFDVVMKKLLERDTTAYIVLLYSPSQTLWKEKLQHRFRSSIGRSNYRRILFFSTMPYSDFMGLLGTAAVILDPFPFGGGVTTLDALALGIPVVTLPSAQTVVQLAAGFYRYMNVTDCIANTTDDYVALAHALATDETLRARVQARIRGQHERLYDDPQTIVDWNSFLAAATTPSSLSSPLAQSAGGSAGGQGHPSTWHLRASGQERTRGYYNPAAAAEEESMNVELKDLAPLLLKKERAAGDIDPQQLTLVLRNGAETNARRKELVQLVAEHPVLSDRNMMFRNHTDRYKMGIKKAFHYIKFLEEHKLTSKQDQQFAYAAMGEPLGIDVHRSMFIPTLENQADPEQQKKWLPLAYSYKIFGAYAQTELGHGSNVQGIETIATYDKQTQEFIINSPTLTSRKWWPGGLGKTATHAIVHARLLLDGKDVGVQAFLVPIRCLKTHQPLEGVEVGDIGPKVGFQSVDNGYCSFRHVRIPRENMMMRYAKVLPDGTFVRPKSDKLVYLTMVQVRAYLSVKFSHTMGMATTITTRFSAVRVQGRKPDGKGEFQVLDYQNQQNALFPYIALSYAANFAGQSMIQMHDAAVSIIKSGHASFGTQLAALHAVSSGLKAWLAENVSDGIERCRRMCGGHGFSQSSNLAHIFAETVGACTFEGTFDVLVQQHARYLLKVLVSLPYSDGEAVDAKTNDLTGFIARAKDNADVTLRWKASTPEQLVDLSLLVHAFEVRAARNLLRLAKEMQATNNNTNACMVLMSRASVAHTELMLLNAFVRGVHNLPRGATQQAMQSLCALFALWIMVNNLGDFRDNNFVSSAQADALRQRLVQLLPVIRKNAVLLTDAWQFSDFELNSVIGRYDGDIYRALVQRTADEPLNATQVVQDVYEQYQKPLIQSGL
ncbi:TPA: hypothetical protein N0F65_007431 [Lagenidium giganteum]|uniref:acyl-CoA oxidase n=1 Tax=Lagenidium giganteum TaxID=4803 RepID=A0AAV2ZLZ0_9STRA|nr:TPA: hypothetical protein N0F65_007431 [Lagenidium giganteum]